MNETIPDTKQSLYQRLKDFMKKNHADNQQIKTGWHERLLKVYVAHHQMQQGKTGLKHPHLWEKHAGKK